MLLDLQNISCSKCFEKIAQEFHRSFTVVLQVLPQVASPRSNQPCQYRRLRVPRFREGSNKSPESATFECRHVGRRTIQRRTIPPFTGTHRKKSYQVNETLEIVVVVVRGGTIWDNTVDFVLSGWGTYRVQETGRNSKSS